MSRDSNDQVGAVHQQRTCTGSLKADRTFQTGPAHGCVSEVARGPSVGWSPATANGNVISRDRVTPIQTHAALMNTMFPPQLKRHTGASNSPPLAHIIYPHGESDPWKLRVRVLPLLGALLSAKFVTRTARRGGLVAQAGCSQDHTLLFRFMHLQECCWTHAPFCLPVVSNNKTAELRR